MIVNLFKNAISFHFYFYNLFSHCLDFYVTQIEHDVVYGSCKESEDQHHNCKYGDPLHDEGRTDQILHEVEGPDQSIEHVGEIVGDVHLVFVSTIAHSGLFFPFGGKSLF